MARQKFRSTRLGGFSGAKAYTRYVEVLKKRRNAVGRTFCDAINVPQWCPLLVISGPQRIMSLSCSRLIPLSVPGIKELTYLIFCRNNPQ